MDVIEEKRKLPVKRADRYPAILRAAGIGLSLLSGIAFVNGSLILGGGFGFYDVGYRKAVAILLSVEVIAARLLERTDQGIRTVERQSWLGLAGVLWLMMNVALARSAQRQYLTLPGNWAFVSWFGVSLFALALSLRIWSARTLGEFFSLNVTVFERHRLVIEGPYRYCRHPAYLGSMLQVIGLTLAFQSLVGLFFLIVFVPMVLWRIRDEEALLAEVFRKEYAEYRQMVPGLFPF